MSEIQAVLQDFLQGKLDFNGLLEAVTRIAAQDPANTPELIDRINGLYREGRLPPQIYGALLSQVANSNNTTGGYTPQTPVGGMQQQARPTAAENKDRTRIAQTPAPATQDDQARVPQPGVDKTRIAPASATSPAPEDHTRIATAPSQGHADDSTRIATEPPRSKPEDRTRIVTDTPVPSQPEAGDSTRIATGARTGTWRTATSSNQSQSSATASSETTGTRTASRNLSHEPAEGDTLKDRFVLEKMIGRGGMGIVFRALDLRKVEAQDRHPYVALKLLNESFKQHAESLMALQREARKAQDLKHPNVIGIFDFDKDEHDNYFIAMELLNGQPLDKIIKSMRGTGMPPKDALRLVSQMGHALAAAHNHKPGIIHSDFKPGNVFLTRDNDIKVFDFGIARAAKPKGEHVRGDETAFDARTLGALTPTYASLEMLEGLDPDPRDDIYALAIVAYELLTGNRPFGRKPANEAMAEGLAPKKVDGLTRRQWKGLLKGLAFKREDRSPSVEVFIDELRFRKSKAPLIIALSGVGLGLASWLLVPPYLEKRREAELISAIDLATAPQLPDLRQQSQELPEDSRSIIDSRIKERLRQIIADGDTDQIYAALKAIGFLPKALGKEIINDSKEDILAFYIGQADAAFSPASGRFDFSRAKQQLDEAKALYPDSIQVFQTSQRMEDTRNDLMNELDSRFNRHLASGQLLPTEDADDLSDVLSALKQLEPKHPLLSDPRLANAFASRASASLDSNDFTLAQAYAESGLQRFPQDPALNNIQVKIRLAQQEELAREKLLALRDQLKQRLPGLKTLEDYLDVAESLASLRAMQPDDTLLSKADAGLRQLLDKRLSGLMGENAWQRAQQLLEQFSGLVAPDYLLAQQTRVSDAETAHEQQLATLFNSLKQAVAQKHLTEPPAANAMELLANARLMAPDDPRIEQSIASISQAYLDLSRKARSVGEWQQARDFVHKGLTLKSLDSVTDSLHAELAEIDKAEIESQQLMAAAERERLQKQRQAKIQALHDEFGSQLKKMQLTAKGGKNLLGILDRLAALNPTDPLLERGRSQIAERFQQEGERLSSTGKWEEAIALVQEGIGIIPESSLLSQQLRTVQQGFSQHLSAKLDQRIRSQQKEIDSLIADPQFNNAWNEKLTAALQALEGLLPAEDDWAEKARQRIGQLHLKRAAGELDRQQFAEAGSLLQSGLKLAPMLAEDFSREQNRLESEESAWEAANQEKVRLARLEGAKQSLLTQAKANDVRTALKTLESLRGELSIQDEFLVKTGPEAIGEAYLRLAERRAKRSDYDAAIKLIDNGLAIAPDMSSLVKARNEYREESTIQDVRDAFKKTTANRISSLQTKLSDLRKKLPERYSALNKEFVEILAKRVESTQDVKAADQLLNAAKALFPDARRLTQIKLEEPLKPAVIAGQGLKAVEGGYLSKAQQLLGQAQKKEQGHPDVARLEQSLKAKVQSAQKIYNNHQAALKKNDNKQAQELIKQALSVWKDNTDYSKQLASLEKTKIATSSDDRCNPKFAGYGKRSSKFRCYDLLNDKQKGPIMVVVPAGGGNSTPYAIGRYEISVGDYNTYCRLSGNCKSISGKSSKLPVSNISHADAVKYARWLSEKTGSTYRLPTEQEWIHAANAKGSAAPGSDFNCLLQSGGSVVKGGAPVDVNVAPQNNWGLFNFIGNVQEWVTSNSNLNALGGHYNDPANDCSVKFSRRHNGTADKVTGFRLLREIKG
jgi:serine/threonine protein kinase